jgi:hypothetical protein
MIVVEASAKVPFVAPGSTVAGTGDCRKVHCCNIKFGITAKMNAILKTTNVLFPLVALYGD